jgi:hypothetical protein
MDIGYQSVDILYVIICFMLLSSNNSCMLPFVMKEILVFVILSIFIIRITGLEVKWYVGITYFSRTLYVCISV